MADVAHPRPGEERQRHPLISRLEPLIRAAFPRGAVILSTITLVSLAMSVLELKVISHFFGSGTITDAFKAAFVLPQLALEVLVVGGVSASFVPVYTGLRDEDREKALEFGRTILTLAILAMTVVVAVMIVFAPQCVSFVAPGFKGDQRDLAINLFRILSVTQIIFAATWVLGEVLIAEKRWLVYAVAPLMYAGGTMVGAAAGALVLGEEWGIYGAALGAVGGMLVYLAIRLFGAWRAGLKPVPSLNLRVKGLRDYAWLMWPKMFSTPLESTVIVLYFTALASTLGSGSITNLSNAQKFQTMSELVIGAQFAIAAFPSLSAAADLGDRRKFKKIFITNLATISALSTAAALGLILVGWLAVRLILLGGAFDEHAAAVTTTLIAIFAVSIPLESLVELLARALYATKNTLIPTAGSVLGFVALFAVSQLLVPVAGLAALPAAYGVGMLVKLGVLGAALAPRMERIGRPRPEPVVDARVMARRPGWPEATPRRPMRTPQMLAGILAVVVIAVAGLYVGIQALNGASFGFAPEVTPWARVRPSAVASVPTVAPTIDPGSSAASPTPEVSATPSAAPTGPAGSPTPPGQFAMDLYQPGDFVGEFKNTHCVPAAMQTMMNIMDQGADTTPATQERLFALANSIAESRQGSPDPEGWSGGLQQLGYGNYTVTARPKEVDIVHIVVKQIRLTNRPAGLLVWYGWHSWVVSGFVATADPAVTDDYQVLGLYIEDVWYNRRSTLWNKTRDGYSRPPDSYVEYRSLVEDFKQWNQAVYYPGKQAQFVVVIPTV